MRATIVNCTLKPSPATSNTEALASVVADALKTHDVEVELVRVADHDVKPGVSSDEGDGDEWPALLEKVLASEILILATPTWLGQISSVAKRVLERLDALLSRQRGRRAPLHRAACAWRHRHRLDRARAGVDALEEGTPGPGPSYLETDEGHERSETTRKTAAQNLVAVARALQAQQMPVPAS